jgi:hypothetical protein
MRALSTHRDGFARGRLDGCLLRGADNHLSQECFDLGGERGQRRRRSPQRVHLLTDLSDLADDVR